MLLLEFENTMPTCSIGFMVFEILSLKEEYNPLSRLGEKLLSLVCLLTNQDHIEYLAVTNAR